MKKLLLITLIFFSIKINAQEIPDVQLMTIDGQKISSNEAIKKGKPFAICFWAVWNKTSLLELNILMENYKDWHDKYGVEMYAICVDEKERFDRAKAYVDAHEWKYKVLFDESEELKDKMKINGVPHLMLFDKEGKLVWQEHSYDSGYEQHFLDQVHQLK